MTERKTLVALTGVEPARPFSGQWILSPSCIPVSP